MSPTKHSSHLKQAHQDSPVTLQGANRKIPDSSTTIEISCEINSFLSRQSLQTERSFSSGRCEAAQQRRKRGLDSTALFSSSPSGAEKSAGCSMMGSLGLRFSHLTQECKESKHTWPRPHGGGTGQRRQVFSRCPWFSDFNMPQK